MELARQLTWARHRAELFDYRTKDKVEVDAVLENRQERPAQKRPAPPQGAPASC
jgi:hypothetical protein